MNYLLPLPDAEGIAQTKAWFLAQRGREITDDEAADILGRLMKHLYLTSNAFTDDTPIKSQATPASQSPASSPSTLNSD